MNAILELLKKMIPGVDKTWIYKFLEYAVLATLLFGLWNDATGSLSTAKSNRDEQIKGYAVQMGQNHSEIYQLKDEVDRLREWNKALSARINRLEDIAIRRGH